MRATPLLSSWGAHYHCLGIALEATITPVAFVLALIVAITVIAASVLINNFIYIAFPAATAWVFTIALTAIIALNTFPRFKRVFNHFVLELLAEFSKLFDCRSVLSDAISIPPFGFSILFNPFSLHQSNFLKLFRASSSSNTCASWATITATVFFVSGPTFSRLFSFDHAKL